MEDAAIVELYWQRSDQAIAETEQKYGRYCRSIAGRICRRAEDAEECVSDTWFRAWNLMPDKRPSRLSVFLGTITRSLALDRIKAETRQKRGGGERDLVLEELADCLATPRDTEEEAEQRELEALVGSFVNNLNHTEQLVFTARYFYLCPVNQIASKLHFSESKVKSMLFRLRKRLRTCLEKEGYC